MEYIPYSPQRGDVSEPMRQPSALGQYSPQRGDVSLIVNLNK